ncbi:hypothetical protein ATANTOWER_031340 [Ataeniobius toweri]|uniref:Uncharacterized protein n=1 Tax=Ataeniobius toweri TaxID=208326 RepID=A0ABU7BEA7_9TELE|nr:hypothetical protein [Ataeniobius toweri]
MSETHLINSFIAQKCIHFKHLFLLNVDDSRSQVIKTKTLFLRRFQQHKIFLPKNVAMAFSITGKTADFLHMEDKPQKVIAKEAGCSQTALSKHSNGKLSGGKTCC